MSFAKQVIIVADKNQLPPTDFFASFADLDAEAQGQDFGVSESLLDAFGGIFEDDRTQVMVFRTLHNPNGKVAVDRDQHPFDRLRARMTFQSGYATYLP